MAASEQSLLPRNRHERRASASAKRKRRKRARQGRAPAPEAHHEQAPADPEPTRAGPHSAHTPARGSPAQVPLEVHMPQAEMRAYAAEEAPGCDLEAFYLEHWSRTRGPLFENPRAAVCRILALAEVTRLSRAGTDPSLRVRASRIWDEALAEVADSKCPATGRAHAQVSAALVDVRRLMRELISGEDAAAELVEIFVRHVPGGHPMEQMRHYAWAELLAATLRSADESLRLRAARTLLARTRDLARQVGREEPEQIDALQCEVIEQFRAELAGCARMDGAPWPTSEQSAEDSGQTGARPPSAAPP